MRIGTDDPESVVRFATSVRGDADNLAAITGSVSQALWGLPRAIRELSLAIARGWSAPWPSLRPSSADIEVYMAFWPDGLTVNKFS